MRPYNKIILIFCLMSFSNCIGQTITSIKPILEKDFVLGQKDFFEKDLLFIKNILDNKMFKIVNYSFVPRTILTSSNNIFIFDRYSCNLIIYDTQNKKASNVAEISSELKKRNITNKFNIDLIDLSGDKLLFYNNFGKEILVFSLTSKKLECSIIGSAPFAVEFLSKGKLDLFAYDYNYGLENCKVIFKTQNKNLGISDQSSFIKFDHNIYMQEFNSNKIEIIRLDTILIKKNKSALSFKTESNYSLVHVNKEYYILTTNIEIGMGEFLFINKATGIVEKRIRISKDILDNSLIDFYDAISEAPSPDVDDTLSYIRMTSINNKYFILFQSHGSMKLYSFFL